MGPGLSWWLADVKETQKHMFTSCIGNINTYTAFITICFSLAGAYIVYADNLARQWQAVLPLLFFLFSVALATGRSDNAVIGIVVFFFVLPCGIGDTRQLCRHLWLVAVFAMAFIMAGILSAYTMNPYMEGQEGILLRAVGGRRASGFAAFIGIAAAAISICGTRHERRPLHRFRRAWAAFLAACCIGSVLVFLHAYFLARPGQYGAAEAYLKFNDSWGTHRGLCWRLAFESYLKFPPIKKLIGSGPDTFGIIMKQEHCQTMIRECGQVFDSPHNELIQYLFCTGILGAVCYYVFLAACFFKGMRGDTIGKTAALAMLVYTAVSFVNISVPITQPYLVILAAWCSGAYQQGKCKKMSIKQYEEGMELNYVRVKSTIPRKQGFAFVDTKKNLADGIFIKHKLFVKFGKEFEKPGEKYKIIFCHVDRKRASDFKDCMKELVDKMLLLGNTDYEEFLKAFCLFGGARSAFLKVYLDQKICKNTYPQI